MQVALLTFSDFYLTFITKMNIIGNNRKFFNEYTYLITKKAALSVKIRKRAASLFINQLD